jgi:hypothetical protein
MDVLAPSLLYGQGSFPVYRFSEEFIRTACFLPIIWPDREWSDFGYVMRVDYRQLHVSQFFELLIIPDAALFTDRGKKSFENICVLFRMVFAEPSMKNFYGN